MSLDGLISGQNLNLEILWDSLPTEVKNKIAEQISLMLVKFEEHEELQSILMKVFIDKLEGKIRDYSWSSSTDSIDAVRALCSIDEIEDHALTHYAWGTYKTLEKELLKYLDYMKMSSFIRKMDTEDYQTISRIFNKYGHPYFWDDFGDNLFKREDITVFMDFVKDRVGRLFDGLLKRYREDPEIRALRNKFNQDLEDYKLDMDI